VGQAKVEADGGGTKLKISFTLQTGSAGTATTENPANPVHPPNPRLTDANSNKDLMKYGTLNHAPI
jgi:hypothetical protein